MSNARPVGYRAEIVSDESGEWTFRVFLLGNIPRSLNREIAHERTARGYASAEDCATSLRHLLKSLPPSPDRKTPNQRMP